MTEFLHLFGYDPLYYWLLSGACVLLWLSSAALPHQPAGRPLQRLNTPVFFGFALLLAMGACRWPAILYYRPINPDESQFLAAAITMLARSDFWWADAGSSGPLVVLPLALPGLFGLPVNYGNGRVIALLLEWGVVFLTYLSLRHIHGDRMARLLVLPLACLMVFLIYWEFVFYGSECLPLFLCALAIWLCLSAFQPEGLVGNRWRLAGGGLVLGLLPFSKFQVIPLGAAIGLVTVFWVLRQPVKERRIVRQDLLRLIASAGGGFALMLLSLWHRGLMADFYESYVVYNLQYVQARNMPWAYSVFLLRYLTGYSWGFASFHYGLLLLLALSLWSQRRAPWRPLLLGWTLLLAAYYAVLAPGRIAPHYLVFLSLPLALLVGLGFGYLFQSVAHHRRLAAALWAMFLAVGVGTQVADRGWDRHALGKLASNGTFWVNLVSYIDQAKRPGDTLVIWGTRPEIYVETQLPQATREALADGQMQTTPQRAYFRARFLADLRTSQPAFFIDSVGPGDIRHRDALREGHETFPALRDYIRQEYSLVGEIKPFRTYVRRALKRAPN